MPSKRDGERDFRLGEWFVQPSLGRVSGPGGTTHLEPRAMELLLYLADRAGEVVSRREILDGVWQREFVSDATVSGIVVKLRKAFRDDAREPRHIETLPKRGYRLLFRPLPVLQVVAAADGAFRVGEWLVEPSLNRMTKETAEVQLERGAMDVLLCLAERAGEPVPRQELVGRAWPSEPVSDLALSRRIEELEEALAGGASGPRYIEAIPDRGFRLAAVVVSAQPGATVTPFPGVHLEPERQVFVGREAELARLDGFLAQAMAGEGRVAFVTGEAGTGKTALVQELLHRALGSHADLVTAVGLSSAQTGIGDPYAPWRQLLALLTGDIEQGSAAGPMSANSVRRLWQTAPIAAEAVVESGRDLVDTLLPGKALLARAEAVATPGAPWLEPLRELVRRKAALPPDVALQQAALFMQMAQVLGAFARRRPLLLVLEDLHWADAGSIALLFHLGREAASHRILILGTYRPSEVALGRSGERHPLEGVVAELRGRHGRLEVDLGQAGDRAFVDAYVDTEPNRLGEGFRASLFRQTAGHALFTVETLRTMQDRGMIVADPEGRWVAVEGTDWATLPERVEGVVAARFQRLPDDLWELLAVASVEGEGFTAEVVARVLGADPREVVRRLSRELEARHRLVRTHGVRVTAAGRLSRFAFSHVLFQRYLYGTLNEAERAQLHEDVGTALEALYGEATAEVAPQLAWHFERAGAVDRAVHHLQRAGLSCARRTAHQEAIHHLRRALDLVATLPPSTARDARELELRMALLLPLFALSGWGEPRVGEEIARAHRLAEGIGDPARLGRVLLLVGAFEGSTTSIPRAIATGERILALADEHGDDSARLLAHLLLGWVTFFGGDLGRSRTHLEEGRSRYDPARHHALALVSGVDPGVACLSHLMSLAARMGHLDLALRYQAEALELAGRLGHPHSLAFAHSVAMWPNYFRHEYREAAERVAAFRATVDTHGFDHFRGLLQIVTGILHLKGGRPDAALELIGRGVEIQERIGTKSALAVWLSALAEAHHAVGSSRLALALLDRASDLVDTFGERFARYELHALRAEVLLDLEGEAAAEACLLEALEAARDQQARTCELEAATRLARLWQGQGRRCEAHDLLAPVYDWFTEGLDTAPLREARVLLEALESAEHLG